jgi:gluconolactonase
MQDPLGNIDGRLVKVVDVDAHEGPVYLPHEDALYFTTRSAIKRLALDGDRFPLAAERVTVARQPAGNANGMTAGGDGTLLVCEQGSDTEPARISRFDPAGGDVATVVDNWRGLPFNSPNDVVVARDGAIWFTDPSYGHLQGFRPQPQVGDYVYRHDPTSGVTDVVADGFVKPNGIAFAPDHDVLYVTDSGANQEPGSYHVHLPHHIVAFDVLGGRKLGNPRLFAVTTPGFPDGIKVDADGHVYASSFEGVQVFSPEGDLVDRLLLPGAVNFTFGGPAGNVLFITNDTAVWAAVLDVKGA